MAMLLRSVGANASFLTKSRSPLLHPSPRVTSLRLPAPTFSKSTRGCRVGVKVYAMSEEDQFDANKFAQDALKNVQEAWEKTDDKVALGTLGFSAFLLLWASAGVISAVDRLPVIPSLFELVGVLYSTWFIYRYLLFKPDRDELWSKIDGFFSDIIGSDKDKADEDEL